MTAPVRTCVGCGAKRAKRELVRLVAAEGSVQVDPSQRAAGRGAYVCDGRCAERAAARKALCRALRGRAVADVSLAGRVEVSRGRT